jgi:hypothetical protein
MSSHRLAKEYQRPDEFANTIMRAGIRRSASTHSKRITPTVLKRTVKREDLLQPESQPMDTDDIDIASQLSIGEPLSPDDFQQIVGERKEWKAGDSLPDHELCDEDNVHYASCLWDGVSVKNVKGDACFLHAPSMDHPMNGMRVHLLLLPPVIWREYQVRATKLFNKECNQIADQHTRKRQKTESALDGSSGTLPSPDDPIEDDTPTQTEADEEKSKDGNKSEEEEIIRGPTGKEFDTV